MLCYFTILNVMDTCALCENILENCKFNLKTTVTKYSHIPLITCNNLINELDAIQIRQQEIHKLFKKYIEKRKIHDTVSDDKLIENVINTINTIDPQLVDKNNSLPSENVINVHNFKTNLHDVEDNAFVSDHASENSMDANRNNSNISEKLSAIQKNCEVDIKYEKHENITNLKSHICHCSKEFSTQVGLRTHIKSHSNYRPFVCEICGQSYKHRAAFNIHIDMHNGINPFTCVYCNKSFTQKGALRRHVPIHTGEMPYQCDECGKRFLHHTSFNLHKLSHTGKKSHKCSICGLALISASHLKRHMRVHTGEKNFSCGICGKRFAERYNLVAHEKLHTSPASALQKKKFNCHICGNDFKRKSKLDEHISKKHLFMKVELDLEEAG